jgi:putative transposase
MKRISYSGYRFPPAIIQQAIWLYLRFTLSLRDVEDLLAERGITVSYESIRRWINHFGPLIAADLRRRRPKAAWPTCGAPSMPRAKSSMCWSSRNGTSMPR